MTKIQKMNLNTKLFVAQTLNLGSGRRQTEDLWSMPRAHRVEGQDGVWNIVLSPTHTFTDASMKP